MVPGENWFRTDSANCATPAPQPMSDPAEVHVVVAIERLQGALHCQGITFFTVPLT